MKRSSAFTLAEVLITLAIIGVVAAMTIPSVIVRTNQQEFKTGFRKAVSVLNQAVTMNMAIDNESPADIKDQTEMLEYLTRRMNVIKTNVTVGDNKAFYTADGFRYEVPNSKVSNCTVANPCVIGVDVNGDRQPTSTTERDDLTNHYPQGNETRVIDFFPIMITDVSVQPYGPLAQRTMYQTDSN